MNNRVLDIETLCHLCDQARTFAQGSALSESEKRFAMSQLFSLQIAFESMKKAQVSK